MPSVTSRQIVRTGIAQFFGGPQYDQEARAYRGSIPAALYAAGLSSVRAYRPKRLSDVDYVKGHISATGTARGMGAYLYIDMPRDTEIRRAAPAAGPGTGYIKAGRKRVTYTTVLNVFHMAHIQHAEDAEADVDALVETIKDAIRGDVSLGGICYQAGENQRGIASNIAPSTLDKEIVGTWATVTFDAEVEIIS